jgi:hypothetical protein
MPPPGEGQAVKPSAASARAAAIVRVFMELSFGCKMLGKLMPDRERQPGMERGARDLLL